MLWKVLDMGLLRNRNYHLMGEFALNSIFSSLSTSRFLYLLQAFPAMLVKQNPQSSSSEGFMSVVARACIKCKCEAH